MRSGRLWDASLVWSWVKQHARIRNERGRVVKFNLNDIQKDARESVGFFDANPSSWSVIVKPRQVGFTSLWMVFLQGLMITHPGIRVLVVTPEEGKIHSEILSKWRDLQEVQIDHGRGGHPGKSRDNIHEYEMHNRSRVTFHAIGGNDNADNTGRGGTFQAVILTELAFPLDADAASAAIAALTPAIDNAAAPVLVDSTPNGTTGPGSTYYSLVRQVRRREKKGAVHFWPWWKDRTKRDDVAGVDAVALARSLSDEERALVLRDGLHFGQILWRRRRMVYPGMSARAGRLRFFQEYPETEDGCFTRPSSTIFDPLLLDALTRRSRHDGFEPPLSAEFVRSMYAARGVHLRETAPEVVNMWGELPGDAVGYVRFFEPPEEHFGGSGRKMYFIGVDGADGNAGSDPQAIALKDWRGRRVAQARVRVDPMILAAIAQRMAIVYDASIRVEDQKGRQVAEWITNRMRPDQADTRGVAWSSVEVLQSVFADCVLVNTGTKNRPVIVDGALTSLRDVSGCLDPETLSEMVGLHRTAEDKIKARPGSYDDIFMSIGLAEAHRRDVMQSTGGIDRNRRGGRRVTVTDKKRGSAASSPRRPRRRRGPFS